MSKHQHGFVLILVLPMVMISLMMLMSHFEKLFFLKKTWLQWQQGSHFKMEGVQRAILMDDHPCVLLCKQQCLTAHLWKIEFEQGYFYIFRPLKDNLCHQKTSLKIYHALVSWHFNPKL